MVARVLIVEDDEMIADVVRLTLSLEGYETTHVANAPAAVSTIAAATPDVILLDIMLPDVDGWEVLDEVRSQPHTQHIPVIVMSAKTMPADQIRAYNLGATGYLPKPFSPDELLEKVNHVLSDVALA